MPEPEDDHGITRRAVDAIGKYVNVGTLLWVTITVAVFIALYVVMVSETSTHPNSARENNLVQFIFLAVGVAASFLFGRQSARAAAKEVLRPVAKGAVRRLANLAKGLGSLIGTLNAHRDYLEQREDEGTVLLAEVGQAQDMLEIQIRTQLNTVVDSIEDWREFLPKEVAKVEGGEEP